MNKLIIVFIIFMVSLVAREEAFATKECPAFNNMKHSKNTHAVHLDTKQKYAILRYHKGQVLILIKGEQPAQRWVDDECFAKSNNGSKNTDIIVDTKKYKNTNINKYNNPKLSQQNILALSWHNAFCETHRFKKECKGNIFYVSKNKYHEKHFVLHGLWPQPRDKTYCGVDRKLVAMDKHKQWNRLPPLGLNEDVKRKLTKVMPGVSSNLHRHEWIKHGTCYGKDVNRYFEDAVSLVEQVNDSKVGVFFTKNIGKHVTLQQIRVLFNRHFGVGTGKSVELKCKDGLITELWLHLGSGSDDLRELLKKGKQTRSRCQNGLIDRAGF